jgi:hypothetical protein
MPIVALVSIMRLKFLSSIISLNSGMISYCAFHSYSRIIILYLEQIVSLWNCQNWDFSCIIYLFSHKFLIKYYEFDQFLTIIDDRFAELISDMSIFIKIRPHTSSTFYHSLHFTAFNKAHFETFFSITTEVFKSSEPDSQYLIMWLQASRH